MNKTDFVHIQDGQALCQVANRDAYKVVAVRRGNTVEISRVYPNNYVDESDPAFDEMHPYVQKRCPWGTYQVSAYQEKVASSGDLVGAF